MQVGGLLGTAGGTGGTGFNVNPGTNGGELINAQNASLGAMTGQNDLLSALQKQNGIQNQSNVYNQLQGVVGGQGPNPAQAQLAQSTGANVANQAALMAGQRGAAANPALMARQAAMTGANIQQQAAGQGATMQANQSLNALGQAGGIAGQMAGNQIGQTNANVQANQAQQSMLQGANTANNQVQGQLANTTLQGQQAVTGGLMQGLSSVGGMMAGGGEVSGYDQGGAVGPQSMFGQFVNTPEPAGMTYGADSGAAALEKGVASMAPKSKSPADPMSGAQSMSPMAGGAADAGGGAGAAGGMESLLPLLAMAAKGGKVQAMVSPGERFLRPREAQAVHEGKANPMKVGEKIPGKAAVKGDSYKNDTVPKKLDVGGIVLPKSVTESKNPGAEAKRFVDAVMAKKRKGKSA